MGKDVCVDEELEGVRSEVMTDSEQRCGDGVAPPHYERYVGVPVEVLVEEHSEHLDGGRWGDD